MKVVLLGASGAVGSEILKLLIADIRIEKIICPLRRDIKANDAKIDKQIGSSLDVLIPKLEYADIWICALGSTMKKAGSKEAFIIADQKLVLMAAEQAEKYGSSQFHVVSAMGANAESLFFYNRVKGNMEAGLSSLQISAIHIYRPSLILADREEHRFLESISSSILKKLDFLFTGKLLAYKPINAADIATFILAKTFGEEKGVFVWKSDAMQPILGRI